MPGVYLISFQSKLSLNITPLGLDLGPEHLDGVDDADVGVVEVEEPPEGDGGEGPDEGDADVGDDGAAAEQLRPDVVDDDGLNAFSNALRVII